MQANLVLLASRNRDPLGYLALGAELEFRPGPSDAGLPTVERSLDSQLSAARELLSLHVARRWHVPSSPSVAELLGEHDTIFAVADAYYLPWVPYCGHAHMSHSFVAEPAPGGLLVYDAYHNDTPWGPARPSSIRLGADQLTAALPGGAVAAAFCAASTARPLPLPLPRYRPPGSGPICSYVQAYREHADRQVALDRLTLETWLLLRARRLHAALLAQAGMADLPSVAEHLRRWGELAEQTYLTYRRVQRGKPEPGWLLDRLGELLTIDATVFGAPDLRNLVAAEIAEALEAPEADLLHGERLRALPGFSSFRLVEIIERLEERLGVEFSPDDLLPENLDDVDSICQIAARAAGAATARRGGEKP
jgi:acyl carrier protein